MRGRYAWRQDKNHRGARVCTGVGQLGVVETQGKQGQSVKGEKANDESGIRTHAPKDQMMLGTSVLHRNCADLSLAP